MSSIEMPYHIELVLTDGLVFAEDCEIKGNAAEMLKTLIEEKGESGDGYKSLEIDVTASIYATPYVPAKIYGPPENCYPEEGGDFDVESLEHAETGIDFAEILPKEALADIETRLMQESNKQADEDRGEYLYEQWKDKQGY